MDHVRRVIVHDKPPILEPEIFSRPANRLALLAAGGALLVQVLAVVRVATGHGRHTALFDHISFAGVALLWLALGLLVFVQRRTGRARRLFLLAAAAGSMFLSLSTLYGTSIVEAFLFGAGLLFFPPLMLSFARAFTEERSWRRAELLLYIPPSLLIVPGADALSRASVTFLWRIGLAAVALYMVAAILQAFYDLRAARSPEQAAQARALLFGLVAGTIPGIVIFITPLVFAGNLAVNTTWLPPLILLFLLSMSYAVLLFEFSEADLIVRRGVVYGVLTLVIVIAYGVLGALLTAGGTTVTSVAGGLGFVAVTVLVGAAFSPIRSAARRLVDWILYGRRVDRWELLQGLSARLAILMQPEELGEVLVREIADALHLRGAFLLRRSGDGFALHHCVEAGSHHDRIPPDFRLDVATVEDALGSPAESVLIVHRKPAMPKYRGVLPERYHVLDHLHAALTIPLVTRSGLEAVLCLHPKLAHDAFDADDLELLAPVMRQASAALDNALLFARLQEKVEELRDAYRRIAQEQEAERARLARELHDGTAQELAGLITLAAVAERQMSAGEEPVRTTLERLRHQAEDAYQGVRRASHALRPPMLDDFGLGPTLDRYLDQFQESTGITVRRAIGAVGPLSDDVELALFRVAQECMENVRKHSGAPEAALHLLRENGYVLLAVMDAGRGMTAPRGYPAESGIGLAGMRERIEAVGGSIRVESEAGGGVRVEAMVPVAGQHPEGTRAAEERWKANSPGLS